MIRLFRSVGGEIEGKLANIGQMIRKSANSWIERETKFRVLQRFVDRTIEPLKPGKELHSSIEFHLGNA